MELHEECGVFGAYDYDKKDVALDVYFGLFALQHRGQESCGIAVNHDGDSTYHKDMGLVSDVFTHDVMDTLNGEIAIGHVRYSTHGSVVRENAQPLVTNYKKGTLSIAHNGNISNAEELKRHFENNGAIFSTNVDSEVIAYLIARERLNCGSVEEAVIRATTYLEGAYSLLVMSPKKLVVARDPFGFRPLCMGKKDNEYVFASETCALDTVGATYIRDIEPGEVLTVSEKGITSIKSTCKCTPRRCIFEYIYFARPDSYIDGVCVSTARMRSGALLAKQSCVEADLVIGVPDSGTISAMGYAQESGIPFGLGFAKNGYVGRSFIKPSQNERSTAVQVKLNPIRENVEGKRIIMVDDSIVRGTTCAKIVKLLKDAGAKEVHVRIASPAFLWPCYFGTDIPTRENLVAVKHSVKEIAKIIGADSLAYLDVNYLHELIDSYDYCDACFTGNYPTKE